MVTTMPTEFWNDSCVAAELEHAMSHGATGATSNPPLVLDALRQEREPWTSRARETHRRQPAATEADVAWGVAEAIAVRGAGLLEPIFERTGGQRGRLSVQVNPVLYRDAAAMLEQAAHLAGLAPNMQVKLPVTTAGLAAMEEATARGINVNATVNFTVAGAIAAGEAIERGLAHREASGQDTSRMRPVCTLMVGRLEDWMRVVCARDGILVTPGRTEWSGVAVFKRAYAAFREHGFRTRLLGGAFRNHLPWSQLMGGDIVLTIPPSWQRLVNASSIEVRPRLEEPVEPGILSELQDAIPDFRRAYEPDGLARHELEDYGAAVRTLRQFIAAYRDLQSHIRDVVLPDPDTTTVAPVEAPA
jgi:transaldolase